MPSELLQFKITLSGTHWNKYPVFSVWLDDQKIIQDEVKVNNHTIEFNREVDDGEHDIKIRLENKTSEDTQTQDGVIVNDMLLNITDIEIDDISLGNLLWDAEYLLDQPQVYQGKEITHLDRCVNLGWNGAYVFRFSSPFYLWLLEKV